jgi:YVTN family beta-propeller protein
VTRVDVPSEAAPVGAGPAGLAAAPDGTLYLTHPDQRAISAVEAGTGRVLRRLPFAGQPFGLAVSEDGRALFVGDWQGGRLVRIDARSGAVEAEIALGPEPAGLVRDRAGRLFVAERGGDSVAVVDGATMTRLARIGVGRAPFALALSPDERRLYVGNVRSNDLTAIDTAALTALATRPAGRSPYGVAVQADLILVTNQESASVSILDADLALRATIPVGRYPEGIAVSEGRAYVANWFSDDVSVIDLAQMREVARRTVPGGPRAALTLPAEPGGAAR